MRIRIDLKIIVFLVLFWFTNQIDIYLTIIFFCITHELGHLLTGLALNLKPESIEIMPYGLSAKLKINPSDLNKKIRKGNFLEVKKIIVSLAGPIVSFLLVIIFAYIDPIYITKQDAVYSNILILIFNLIPLYPLDGGRIVKSILHIIYGNKFAKKVVYIMSNIIMVILSFIFSIAVFYFQNIAYFLICVLLWCITLEENKKYRNYIKIYDYLDEYKN